jgi:hypothetical protein
VDPAEKVPVAVICCFSPLASVEGSGSSSIELRTSFVTVRASSRFHRATPPRASSCRWPCR